MTSRIGSVGLNLAVLSSFSFKARLVALSTSWALRISLSAFSRAFLVWFLVGMSSFTVILPVVRVPVLSRQIVSTRARVSME